MPDAATSVRGKIGRAILRRALKWSVNALARRLEPAEEAAREVVERAREYGGDVLDGSVAPG